MNQSLHKLVRDVGEGNRSVVDRGQSAPNVHEPEPNVFLESGAVSWMILAKEVT